MAFYWLTFHKADEILGASLVEANALAIALKKAAIMGIRPNDATSVNGKETVVRDGRDYPWCLDKFVQASDVATHVDNLPPFSETSQSTTEVKKSEPTSPSPQNKNNFRTDELEVFRDQENDIIVMRMSEARKDFGLTDEQAGDMGKTLLLATGHRFAVEKGGRFQISGPLARNEIIQVHKDHPDLGSFLMTVDQVLPDGIVICYCKCPQGLVIGEFKRDHILRLGMHAPSVLDTDEIKLVREKLLEARNAADASGANMVVARFDRSSLAEAIELLKEGEASGSGKKH